MISYRQALMKEEKFWLYYPSGRIDVWSNMDIEHDIRQRKHKNVEDDSKDIRGRIDYDALYLEAADENMIEWALRHLPSKYLVKNKYLVVDTFDKHHGTIPIDQGEDALRAWLNRHSIRKRIKSSLKQADILDKFKPLKKHRFYIEAYLGHGIHTSAGGPTLLISQLRAESDKNAGNNNPEIQKIFDEKMKSLGFLLIETADLRYRKDFKVKDLTPSKKERQEYVNEALVPELNSTNNIKAFGIKSIDEPRISGWANRVYTVIALEIEA